MGFIIGGCYTIVASADHNIYHQPLWPQNDIFLPCVHYETGKHAYVWVR